MSAKSFIATLDVFKSLPPRQLAELEKTMVEKKYLKGESIFLEGDPANYVWFVKEGHVKAVAHTAEGRDVTLCLVGANNMFGTCCCFGGGAYPCHTIAETDVTVTALPMAEFLSSLDKFPSLSRAVVEQISKRLRHSKDMQTFEQESVETRILHLVVHLASEFGDTIPLTKREIAEMAGTTVESSIRTFSRLEKEGLVSGTRGKIIVKNVHALADRLEKV